MGFTPKQTLYRLVWPDTSTWHGFEVDMRSIPIGQLLDLAAMADTAKDTKDTATIEALFVMLADNIETWNLEIPAGNPLPCTVETLRAQTLELTMAITQGWIEALTEVPAPLDSASTAGVPLEVASMPMETLSLVPVS